MSEKLKKLDRLANSCDELDNLELLDFAYCYKVRSLYQRYKSNQTDLEECKKRKEEIAQEYQKCSDSLSAYQDNIKKSEELRAEINKSSDEKEMLSKCLEIVSLLTDDEVFFKKNKEKIS